MAADTYTAILNLILMGTGNDNNAWGVNLNAAIQQIENKLAGVNAIAGLTGGAYALTQANAAYNTITLAGTLTSDLTITVPSTANKWTFVNNLTMAGFYVLIKTSGGTAVNIPGGANIDITCDGTSMYRADKAKVGELFMHAGTTVPAGALECNGATPLRASALDLFTAIGTTWGVGNGTTTFTIPDGYTAGKFLRSRTASVTIGTAQTNQNKSHTHTGSGTTSGVSASHTHTGSGTTSAMSANASHTHTVASTQIASSGASSAINVVNGTTNTGSTNTDHTHTYSFTTSTDSVDHTHTYSFTTSTGSADGTEARPESLVGMLCIRY